MATKKLTKSKNRTLAGVCGGLAQYLDFDVTIVRIVYTVLTFFSGAFPGVILYIIMMLIMPDQDPNDGIEEAEVVG